MKKSFWIIIFLGGIGVCHAQDWEYKEVKDEMRGTVTHIASLKSENEIQYSPPYDGGASLEILLFSNDGEISDKVALVLSNGQVSCSKDNVCDVQAKFGNGKVEDMTTKIAGDKNEMLVVFDAPEFVEKLRLSQNLIIEIPVYREARSQFKFLPGNLDWKGVADGRQFLSMLGSLNLRERQNNQSNNGRDNNGLICNKDDKFSVLSNAVGKANICTIGGLVARVDILYPYDKNTFKRLVNIINKSLGSNSIPYNGTAMWLSDETGGIASIFLTADKKEGVKLNYMNNPVLSVYSPKDK
ncbi:hypothetical protein HZI30_08860 [Serratia fonticola]|uniref:hypothetical protein n=1 Tax=Serratia fonticola TaxID=47917 RepID=UPI0015C5912B|nr:hypothetical protein [Serratia fonticola]NXZ87041.1 hypothetical protein [Serratia fonticola]